MFFGRQLRRTGKVSNEQICKAVDIIVSKKLESINFDSTIIATIIDNSEAE